MRKNVASQHVGAQVNSRSDGSPITTSVGVQVTGDGGTQTGGGGTLTHKGNGWWDYAPTQGETNFTHVAFTFTHTTGVHQSVQAWPVSYDPTDSVRLGLTALPNAAAASAGGLLTSGSGSNQIASTSGKVDVNDKTGFSLSAAGVQAIWDSLTSALTAAGSIGKRLADNIDATIASRLAAASISLAGGAVTVSTNNDKTGYALTSGERDSVADALLDRANGVESGRTLRQSARLWNAAAAGKSSGAATTTFKLRDQADSKDRVSATVDADGNRTAVTVDLT